MNHRESSHPVSARMSTTPEPPALRPAGKQAGLFPAGAPRFGRMVEASRASSFQRGLLASFPLEP